MQQQPELEGLLVNGRYEVAKRLQSGFFGTTWLARDTSSGEEVCLKTFARESSAQRKELAVLRELCMGLFCHENLCAVLDVSLEHCPVHSIPGGMAVFSLQYVVFEYCCGSDLFNFLVTGPFERQQRVSSFPEPLARHYFTQVLMAVMYLHERGVFHRDIKPENCVLDQHFNLKLTDFGTNKIFPLSSEPTQVLRTATANIGTDSYRAPEVNGIHGYDPAAADIWSLGVMLYFLTGIEEMVVKVKTLDPYQRPVLAPLGILFPFPVHCTLLDSYLQTEEELRESIKRGVAPRNERFWQEWSELAARLSPSLCDLLNAVFLLQPSLRCSLQQLAAHSWLAREHLSPQQVSQHMISRCPSDVKPSQSASPRVVSNQLGGVDQAALRQSLSSQNSVPEFLADAEVVVLSDRLLALEALQTDMLAADIQDFMMDGMLARSLLRDLLSSPSGEQHRSVPASQLPPSCRWLPRLLSCLGYLPQGRDLFLPFDALDLTLVHTALSILDGIELAVTRGAVSTAMSHDDMIFEPSSLPTALEGHMTAAVTSDSGVSMMEGSHDPSVGSHDLRPPLRKFSSNPEYVSHDLPQADTLESFNFIDESSQDSGWTAGSLSAQSSQEEVPEVMLLSASDGSRQQHCVMELGAALNRTLPHQYRGAVEFCRLSGLLASYGLYQVVCREQLLLYCRGSTTSFSARLVAIDNDGKVAVSSWCFVGVAEWAELLERVKRDMSPQRVFL